MADPTRNRVEPTSFFNIIEQARLAWRLFRDPRLPWAIKAVPFATALYVVLPLDFLPDFIPGLGQLDDLAAIFLGVRMLIELAPQELVDEHLAQIRGQAVPDSAANPLEPGMVIEGELRPTEEANRYETSGRR